jgi:hypothetical protein
LALGQGYRPQAAWSALGTRQVPGLAQPVDVVAIAG